MVVFLSFVSFFFFFTFSFFEFVGKGWGVLVEE